MKPGLMLIHYPAAGVLLKKTSRGGVLNVFPSPPVGGACRRRRHARQLSCCFLFRLLFHFWKTLFFFFFFLSFCLHKVVNSCDITMSKFGPNVCQFVGSKRPVTNGINNIFNHRNVDRPKIVKPRPSGDQAVILF